MPLLITDNILSENFLVQRNGNHIIRLLITIWILSFFFFYFIGIQKMQVSLFCQKSPSLTQVTVSKHIIIEWNTLLKSNYFFRRCILIGLKVLVRKLYCDQSHMGSQHNAAVHLMWQQMRREFWEINMLFFPILK